MGKNSVQFECTSCGHISAKWLGNCPNCGSWNSFEEAHVEKAATQHKSKLSGIGSKEAPKALKSIAAQKNERISTGIGELDRVLGGGLLKGAYILLGGDPGVGKSTLTLQMSKARPETRILYCAGEESASQIQQRAARMGVRSENLYIYCETLIDDIAATVKEFLPDVLIIDSIQTVYRQELQSMHGSVQQVRECAGLLQQVAKKMNIPTIIIGHVTKDGDIAGPRMLEHMVDTVLQFEGDKHHTYRLLRVLKNRFGATNEVGIFEMLEYGLREVANPSEFFISENTLQTSGTAITCALEGSRPILLEVQALVTPASYGTPQRTVNGFDRNRLAMLLAVLEKRAGYGFSAHDVYLNIAGGFKLTDPAGDLAVQCALISSLKDILLPERSVFIGEVGLSGEVRSIPMLEQRKKEAMKLGFGTIYHSGTVKFVHALSSILFEG